MIGGAKNTLIIVEGQLLLLHMSEVSRTSGYLRELSALLLVRGNRINTFFETARVVRNGAHWVISPTSVGSIVYIGCTYSDFAEPKSPTVGCYTALIGHDPTSQLPLQGIFDVSLHQADECGIWSLYHLKPMQLRVLVSYK